MGKLIQSQTPDQPNGLDGAIPDDAMTVRFTIEIQQVIVPGEASGIAAAADEPISFWGGLDPNSGEIIDRRHPLSGHNISGGILVIPNGRGSCSASGVFLEAIRNGFAPAAIIVSRIDPILGLGSILGDELYSRPIPIIVISEKDRLRIQTGDHVVITQRRVFVASAMTSPR